MKHQNICCWTRRDVSLATTMASPEGSHFSKPSAGELLVRTGGTTLLSSTPSSPQICDTNTSRFYSILLTGRQWSFLNYRQRCKHLSHQWSLWTSLKRHQWTPTIQNHSWVLNNRHFQSLPKRASRVRKRKPRHSLLQRNQKAVNQSAHLWLTRLTLIWIKQNLRKLTQQ